VTAASIPPAIGATPTSLSFTAKQGSANPATQTLSLSNSGGGTLSWSASDNAPWLTLSPASGSGPGAVTLTATTGTLTTSNYSGTVTLSATGAIPVTIPVTFTVTAASLAPAIGVSPTSLYFTAKHGGGNPPAQTLTISNTGSGTLTWTAVDSGGTWLWHAGGASTSGAGTVTVGVTTDTLTAGTYSGQVTIWPIGAPSVTIPVTYIVQ